MAQIFRDEAIRSLYANVVTVDAGNEFEAIDASGNEVSLNEVDIAAEVTRLNGVYDGLAYQRVRAEAYAELKEQLDQLYHDMTAGKLDATGEWHKAIKAVKDATPKP
jgi:hypothetical protein